jgi:hypothetical protein
MSDYYRIIEKGKRKFIVDINGDIVPPEVAKNLSAAVIKTAEDKSYVYVGPREDGMYKIGFTTRPNERPNEAGLVQVDHLIECPLYGEFSGWKIETALHNLFKVTGQHVEGEFFDLGIHGLELIQGYCLTPETTLDLVSTFKPIFVRLSQQVNRDGGDALITVVAETVRKQIDPLVAVTYTYFIEREIFRLTQSERFYEAGYIRGAMDMFMEVRAKKISDRIKARSDSKIIAETE